MGSSSSSDYDSDEEQEEIEKIPLKKRDIFANRFKDQTPGLMYLKFAFNGRNLRKFFFKGKLIHNIIDVYEMRKRLYKIRDAENANYDNLLGHHIHEYNFGGEDEPYFESNYESGNLCLVIKVSLHFHLII